MSVSILNAWGLFIKGGAMMWPILLLSIIILTVAVERFLEIHNTRKRMVDFAQEIAGLIRANRLKDALILCDGDKGLLGNIFKMGLLKYAQPKEVIVSVMKQEAEFAVYRLKKRLGLLALATNVAPLLGVLGTMSSLVVVFHAVQMRSNALNPLSLGDMSSGIWQAMICSAAGLLVGIVGYVSHAFMASLVNETIVMIEKAIVDMAFILQNLVESTQEDQVV